MNEKLIVKYKDLILKDVSREYLYQSLSLLKRLCYEEIDFDNIDKRYYDLFIPFFPEIERNISILRKWIQEGEMLHNDYIEEHFYSYMNLILKDEKENDKELIFDIFVSLNLLPDFINTNPKIVKNQSYSFIMDVSQLIFHQAYFGILEDKEKNSFFQKPLSKIFFNYTRYLNSPTDMYYIRSLCYDLVGDKENHKIYALNAILTSHSDNHEFMTLVQNFWSILIEEELFEDAIKFLLSIQSKILPHDIEEYNQFFILTYTLIRKKYIVVRS